MYLRQVPGCDRIIVVMGSELKRGGLVRTRNPASWYGGDYHFVIESIEYHPGWSPMYHPGWSPMAVPGATHVSMGTSVPEELVKQGANGIKIYYEGKHGGGGAKKKSRC